MSPTKARVVLPKPRASGTVELPATIDGETYVYRAYCRCGDLLYVGMTGNLFGRLSAHYRSRAEWERKAVRLDWELYPTRVAAERAEDHQIRTLHPPYNTARRSRRPANWVDLPWPTFDPTIADRDAAPRIRARLLGNRL